MEKLEKPAFHNLPPEQEEEKKREEKRVLKEMKKQEEIAKKIADAERVPLRARMKNILFWVLLGIVGITYGIKFYSYVRIITTHTAEVQFAREHSEFVRPIMKLYEQAHGSANAQLLEALTQ
jgi:dolichol kinase